MRVWKNENLFATVHSSADDVAPSDTDDVAEWEFDLLGLVACTYYVEVFERVEISTTVKSLAYESVKAPTTEVRTEFRPIKVLAREFQTLTACSQYLNGVFRQKIPA